MKIEHLEKYSKRALIRAYLCAHSEGQSGCPAGGGEHCKMMKGCRKVTPADWWNDDVLPEYKDFQISGLNTDTTLFVADAIAPEVASSTDAAYIVAACNAVPRLVEMLRIAVSFIEAQNARRAREGEMAIMCETMQLLFTMTEPKE